MSKQVKQSAPTVVGSVEEELSFGSSADSSFVPSTKKIELATKHGALPPAMLRIRKLAKERSIDLTKVKGSGPGGCILERDL